MKLRAALALLLLTAWAIAYQIRATQPPASATSLASYVPQDALLTIESPDFASLLHRWTQSAESKTWLASDNYAVFQNSRLFGRLSDAQASFAKAAGVPTDVDLLNQVAGKESVFAWYDIGKLEFLYITRMSAAQAEQTELFQARATFERRHAGNADFYIRTSTSDYSTVAFARVPGASSDLVLLATREDLIANALKLIASPSPTNSIQQEPWFHDVSEALPTEKQPPVLHMVLNLDRIAVDPHFRTYWIQRNITWTRQFRAAASDLYIERTRFREERVLLPKSAEAEPAKLDLDTLATIVPPSTGVFRIMATRDASVAVAAIQEKLLGVKPDPGIDPNDAPNPVIEAPPNGSASDLETRIDMPPLEPSAAKTDKLGQVFQAMDLDAVLTLSSAETPANKDGLWVPIHSAVVLHAGVPVNPQALAIALQQSLQGSLTTANIGTGFQPTNVYGTTIYALTGPRPFFFAAASTPASGNLVLFADDQNLLSAILSRRPTRTNEKANPAVMIGVFNHTSQRVPYAQLTALIDGTNNSAHNSRDVETSGSNGDVSVESTPDFFSRNIGSLSTTFAHLQSEQVVERVIDGNRRQTVTYTWHNP
jgi:hypothetical protein